METFVHKTEEIAPLKQGSFELDGSGGILIKYDEILRDEVNVANYSIKRTDEKRDISSITFIDDNKTVKITPTVGITME
jgi:hypothetical protein